MMGQSETAVMGEALVLLCMESVSSESVLWHKINCSFLGNNYSISRSRIGTSLDSLEQ